MSGVIWDGLGSEVTCDWIIGFGGWEILGVREEGQGGDVEGYSDYIL